ncbi:MAG TPA: KamA family radical SAM protein [Smithellaceae bacterium]|nr:KamA family radical SAM protein [Smithellaceae bacterium]HPB14980.1 KamA family radical SAM protein [Smithellaceae bacterium]HPV72008.1 KamA family radical SAM protein [Smithellaceae bacterium]HPY06438.1 KamA family radical SAM protein [Smithellaceae bacterium]HQC09964.1 KamA family radical SAM protein [Smithellaceae bacterium]
MENETLFNEDAEPPGPSAGLVVVPNKTTNFFSLTTNNHLPSLAKSKPERLYFPFKDSPRSRAFRKKHYPDISRIEWFDWRWQFQNAIRHVQTLDAMVHLSDNERQAMMHPSGDLPVAITPYYASLISPEDPSSPLRRCVIPVVDECLHTKGEEEDPLGEDADSPVPGIVHRYPDRVLFLVTDICSTYCRYCTRSRIFGRQHQCFIDTAKWEKALDYIASNPNVRDVLLSGGDPLTLSDDRLEWLLSRLKEIPHVELVRIGTKVPVVMPQRITTALVSMLKKCHPLWMSIHVTHPDELTPEMSAACIRLADAGIPLGSQTVLLAGINDSVSTMTRLVHGLLQIRVRPYYLYQCDPIPGSSHFRTPISKGLEIIQGLRGHTTGYAVPTFVVDAPGGGGKIPLLPEYAIGWDKGDLMMRNYEGNIFRYPDNHAESKDIH